MEKCLFTFIFLQFNENTINIFVIGQSGVGKSTWINSILNYIKYLSLEDAERLGVITEIPTSFTITDSNFETITVNANSGGGGSLNMATSQTKNCELYNFEWRNQQYCIIDTPGFGDTDGFERDQENVQNMIKYLTGFPQIHAICMLMKPNESRSGVFFECFKDMLLQLHPDVSENLLICFTNSRNTFYKPGETLSLLKPLLTKIGFNTELSERIFCLDNESYRYLLIIQQTNVKFIPTELAAFKTSWNRSRVETFRLLERMAKLKPFPVQKTIELVVLREKCHRLMFVLSHIIEKQCEFLFRSQYDRNVNIRDFLDLLDIEKYEILDFLIKLEHQISCQSHLYNSKIRHYFADLVKTEREKSFISQSNERLHLFQDLLERYDFTTTLLESKNETSLDDVKLDLDNQSILGPIITQMFKNVDYDYNN